MKVVLLAGGTGGAKLAHGFQQVLPPGDLTVIVNVADDAEPYGLPVSPDLDTIMYTLAGIADPVQGWGVAGDTTRALDMLRRYGADTWFTVGDADLATHLRRQQLLRQGLTLTDATASMAAALGVPSRLLPITDDRVRTMVRTDAGELDFQTYFVRNRQADQVRGLRLEGIEAARPSPAALDALAAAELLVIGPSNPLVSIGPILAVPGVREAVAGAAVPRIGVSGIVAGRALRGPADRMMATLGHEVSARGVARLYAGLVDLFVVDAVDAELAPAIEGLGMRVAVLPTVMEDDAGRAALAGELLRVAATLSSPA
ncbi:MAG TPA: 2-phospho-L-lactate transferase [candidate division Zixibacteria bacterium]|nr:2-phospho-L-lactate transferase [candidate division Zixibacteria bacterium]